MVLGVVRQSFIIFSLFVSRFCVEAHSPPKHMPLDINIAWGIYEMEISGADILVGRGASRPIKRKLMCSIGINMIK